MTIKPTPIAIIGMSCRLPGHATNPENFWQACAEKQNLWQSMPNDRLPDQKSYHPDYNRCGTSNAAGAHFLQEHPGFFDAQFFGINDLEASAMDPQQRMLLELSYEAFENAGLQIAALAKSKTAVFIGSSCSDYSSKLCRDLDRIEMFQSTGTGQTMLANRISYFYDLRGPSVAIDTACSSSLVALHLACNSLRARESNMALAGGANLILEHSSTIALSMLGFLSSDGRCFSYDERANGFGRGEGASCMVLKRLDDAIECGDAVRAVILNSGTNQDGKTLGISLPSGDAQIELFEQDYRTAGLDPAETAYIEAHGTGTPAGDPIEANSIARTFTNEKARSQPLLVGSVKSNIGHLEGGSGIASILKVVLMLERNLVLPNYDFRTANPRIPMEEWNIKVPQDLQQWPNLGKPRASVFNFGFGGSNAHVILEAAQQHQSHPSLRANGINGSTKPDHPMIEDGFVRKYVFHLSASSEVSGRSQIKNLVEYLKGFSAHHSADLLARLAYTLSEKRSKHQWNTAIAAGSLPELISSLEDQSLVYTKSNQTALAFVFTGQGAQWWAMGRDLIHHFPVFRNSLLTAQTSVEQAGVTDSLIDQLLASEDRSRVYDVSLSQTLTTAIQIALVDLLRSWNISPSAVVGHSSGEIAAAYCAGILSQNSAMRIAHCRSIISAKLRSLRKGAMLAVGLSREETAPLLSALKKGTAKIACVNSPASVTVSGDTDAVEELMRVLKEQGTYVRKLAVEVAYHSAHTQLVADEYESMIHNVPHDLPREIQFYSSLTGKHANPEVFRPQYWVQNFTNPVEFSAALGNLLRDSESLRGTKRTVIVEIGPHSALRGPIRQICDAQGVTDLQYFSPIQRGISAGVSSAESLIGLIVTGIQVNVTAANFPEGDSGKDFLTNLPPYPWDHSRFHWAQAIPVIDRALQFPRSDIIGVKLESCTPLEPIWRNIIRITELPWIKDHVIQGNVLYPAAGYLVMAIEAMGQKAFEQSYDDFLLKDISIKRALIIPRDVDSVETRITLRPDSKSLTLSWDEFSITSSLDGVQWTENCSGFITVRRNRPENGVDDDHEYHEASYLPHYQSAFDGQPTSPMPGQEIYQMLEKRGLSFGPTFRNLKVAWVSGNTSHAEITMAETSSSMPVRFEYPYSVHPATLDGFIHALFPLASTSGEVTGTPVPTSIDSMCMSKELKNRPESLFDVYAHQVHVEAPYSLAVFDRTSPSLRPQVSVQGLTMTTLAYVDEDLADRNAQYLDYRLKWQPDPAFLRTGSQEFTSMTGPPINLKLMEEATFYFAQKALQNLGNEDVRKLQSHHFKLYEGLAQWVESEKVWSTRPDEERSKVTAEVSATSLGILLSPIGNNLAQIFRGECSALSLMTEDDRLDRFYSELEQLTRVTSQIGRLVGFLGNQNPHLRILEVGAGTGSATLPILQALNANEGPPSLEGYDFTDVSVAFFEKARLKLEGWADLVDYKIFDLERDPASQGYEDNTYDVIVASNVIHATELVHHTLQRLHRLLKPGGKLILMEITTVSKGLHLIFGTLPGWWAAKEPSRAKSPLVEESTWKEVLAGVGFRREPLILRDTKDYDGHVTSAFICEKATKVDSISRKAVVTARQDQSLLEGMLKDLLTKRGSECQSTKLSDYRPTNHEAVIFLDCGKSILRDPSTQEFEAIKGLLSSSKAILWVTDNSSPDSALVTGFTRCARNEAGESNTTILNLQSSSKVESQVEKIVSVSEKVFGGMPGAELEYGERQGEIVIPRLVEDRRFVDQDAASPHRFSDRGLLTATSQMPGDLSSIVYESRSWPSEELPDDKVGIQVRATGINFRDVMVGLGQIPMLGLGCECAGVVSAVGSAVSHVHPGDRVIAIPDAAGCFGNKVRATPQEIGTIADTLAFEEAAALPIVYYTAYWAVFKLALLQQHESVLIHAASGGLGQALICLCKMIGATIFATVGTPEKKALLIDKFQLLEENIFSSREYGFAEGVMAQTEQRGVDVVMNSLSGEALELSWSCIAPFGRFIELGKRDFVINSRLPMKFFAKNVTFSAFDAHLEVQRTGSHDTWRELMQWYEAGKIQLPTPITAYGASELELALRTMQSGRHMGKLVIMPRPDEVVSAIPSKVLFKQDASYLIIGGLGGIGRAIIAWMLDNGAKNFIMASPSGLDKPRSQEAVSQFIELGANVLVLKCDVGDGGDVEMMLATSREQMPPIRGLIHSALILRSALLSRMTVEAHLAVLKPKVDGVWNLHNQLSKTDLDFFIMLSSISGLLGPASQASYAAASTFEDAFAEFRNRQNLPATSIDLGKVLDVGVLTEDQAAKKSVQETMTRALYKEDVIAAIRKAVRKPISSVSDLGSTMVGLPPWTPDADPTSRTPMFSHYRRAALEVGSKSSAARGKSGSSSICSDVRKASSSNDAIQIFYEAIKLKCSSLLNLSLDSFQPEKSLLDYGLDSLVAVELRKWLLRELDITVPVLDLMAPGSSLHDLSEKLVRQVRND